MNQFIAQHAPLALASSEIQCLTISYPPLDSTKIPCHYVEMRGTALEALHHPSSYERKKSRDPFAARDWKRAARRTLDILRLLRFSKCAKNSTRRISCRSKVIGKEGFFPIYTQQPLTRVTTCQMSILVQIIKLNFDENILHFLQQNQNFSNLK